MMRFSALVVIGLVAATGAAQSSLVIPNGLASQEGSTGNDFPWGRGNAGLLHQCVYDSSHFTLQGITSPILIQGLRWRPNTGVGFGAVTYPTPCSVRVSTCPVDWTTTTTTFAANRGTDETLCFQGPVSFGPQAAQPGPSPFGIVIPFSTPFLYDPSRGDLTIECDLPVQFQSMSMFPLDVHGVVGQANATRIQASAGYSGYPGGTADARNSNHAVVVQVDYGPAIGLFPSFTATPTSAPLGAVVQFTDHTFSSAPGGVISWQWDFENDGVFDSNAQNPSHVYTTEGVYSVKLQVVDGVFGTRTFTLDNFLRIDTVQAAFTSAVVTGNTVQFTDTSTGNPVSWRWDFQNDGIIDSTLRNPTFTYPVAGAYDCRLKVSDAISSSSVTTNLGINTMPMPPFDISFGSSVPSTRGFYFQAPTRFSIVSALVPDEAATGLQNIAIYRLAGAPPIYPGTATGGLDFFQVGAPSSARVACALSFEAGEWVGVLGACGNVVMVQSYGGGPVGPFASSVLGMPAPLTQLRAQANIALSQGANSYSSDPASVISRVILGVSACTSIAYGAGTPSGLGPPAPALRTGTLPLLGSTATILVDNQDLNAIGVLAVGSGRANLPTPLGTELVATIGAVGLIPVLPLGIGSNTFSFVVPNDAALQGQGPFNWQDANLTPSGQVALSNGLEWFLAQ